MENIKFIDITQLPEDLWQDAKNLIAVDSNGDVIKAAKQDSYTKDEIDELLKDAEISADKLQNKIKINSASTDYIVTQPTVSGDSLVITDAMSDKNQYHTFGYDKTITATSNKLLDYSTPLFRGSNEYNCPQWDGNTIRFANQAGIILKTRLTIPYTYNGVKYVTHFDIDIRSQMYTLNFGVINDPNFPGYQSVKFKESEVYKAFGANETFVFKTNNYIKDYASLSLESTYDFLYSGMNIEMSIGNFQLTASNGGLIIETPRFYISENNVLRGDVPNESQSSDHPERLSDYIRYSNDVKAYILTNKNTTFKTINGEQITGNGDITIDTNVDLSNYATKSELNTKQDVISDLDSIRSGAEKGATALQSVPSEYATEQWVNSQGFLKEHQDISNLATKSELNDKQDKLVSGTNIKSINGASLLGSGNMELATKEELNAKQDTINDLQTIRSGAALGATALQSVPDTYALKSEIPDISTKQDTLVSGTNIKTVNGTSLLGSGNIEINASADNVPTLQTTVEGTTSNYIYSSGTFDKYGVLSKISNIITYSTDKASIATYRYYWGSESSNVYQNWSINAATTSQAGLMSASDKTKLDGIDLATKQDTLVSGTNIKTINGTSLLGSGDITIEGGSGNVDLSNYYTKPETNALVSPKLSQVTLTQAEYNALSTKEENVLYVISDAEEIKFKTINGAQITGDGNIELATKEELNTKQDVISDLDSIRSGAAKGSTALQSVPSGYATEQWVNEQGFLKEHQDISNLATKQELATKQDVINDLETIRSGAALGATALQSVPDTYALKSEIPDITTKQDKLISGSNIKTINGNSLLGSGDITIEGGADLSGYYTKSEIDAMIGGASSTITEINNLVV